MMRPMENTKKKNGVIGKRIPLIDAMRKTTGEGFYTDDIKLPGMLVVHHFIRRIFEAAPASSPR